MIKMNKMGPMDLRTSSRARKMADHRTRVGHQRRVRTETRILEAALEVFADQGPEEARIDDFVRAAGISRGTFYNHFQSVDELRAATSEWMTRELIDAIETTLGGLDEPALRLGVGLRLFMSKAQADPIWSRFVARTWKLDGVEMPARDLERGLRLGVFRAPSATAARDLVFGAVREALWRIGTEPTSAAYASAVTELCLRALGVDARSIGLAPTTTFPTMKPTKAG